MTETPASDEKVQKETTIRNEPSIAKEINLFVNHLESLKETLPITMMILEEVNKTFQERLKSFERDNCKVEEVNDEKIISIPTEHYKEWKINNSANKKYFVARTLMPRSLIVTMVCQYDAFLGRLLRCLYLLKPEILNASEKNYSFKDVSKFISLSDFKDFVIEKEVETILRKSHYDQITYLENVFKVNLRKDQKLLSNFIEITERRNLFVHTDGIVSSQYLLVCTTHKCDIDNNIKEGSTLHVSKEYFDNAYMCLYEIGIKLAYVLWRNVLPSQIEKSDENLNSITYELIDRGEFELACSLIDFALDSFKKSSTDLNKSILIVNCAQAHKWAGRNKKCLDLINSLDCSAKEDQFKLAKEVLLENWDAVYSLMRRIGKQGLIDKVQYRDWPLFKELRKQNDFLKVYEEIFGEAFEVKITKPDNDHGTASDDGEGVVDASIH